nr:SWI/SNF-related matrix-associated actin-dependent regulator of chromatin subfamily A-like protein 1 [Procambarus clarkii]XP_045583793.1 SWI/SNF-related matrix-associated actin-dependent regulator of chromatin subfamily A-like protein 1 [Procambarus clarkii]XP_045583794.1 SWI/SNF-related matrix-associated actin-dependent regulator of chromatin subfamily A-like protein 1 [Procambarus clarkii]XP_045583795.1 SWI/SNF-related matrix-associated actin-dependent regulator of chromatin subfamily A-like
MSSLTEEQRRRIEENRLKALQKRTKQQVSGGSDFSNVFKGTGPSFVSSSSAQTIQNKNTEHVNNAYQPQSLGSSSNASHSNYNDQASFNTPSTYTDEAKRIEENRRRALEKRAAQMKSLTGNVNSQPSVQQNSLHINADNPSSVGEKSASSFYKTSQTNQSHQTSVPNFRPNKYNSGTSKPVTSFKAAAQPVNGLYLSPTKVNTILNHLEGTEGGSSGGSPTKVTLGKTVKGTFRLQSLDRFIVDVGFHSQMIEVFKTMTTKQYDASIRKWNFALSEHDKLVTALSPLRPAVCISPLPSFVRKALASVTQQVPASCVDLFGLDPKLLDSLMPFQHDGVCFGVSLGGRAMFADDMGLGKTIQALGVAAYYRREWPMLVVTPSTVRYSWVSSIERWVSSVNRSDIVVIGSGRDNFNGAEVVIVSYDLLSRRAKEILDHNFQVVIMDESHMLKSFKTARYKAAAPIMKKAKRVLLLSGTPALSRPSELFTQINGINPKLFPSFQEYGIRYCAGNHTPWGWDFSGFSNMEELQIILQAKLMIRRLKSEVLDQLPAKQRMTVILDPASVLTGTKAMQAAAKQLGLKTLNGAERHGALLQFFIETAQAKLKAVSDYVKELLESDKKFLVFAHHKVMMDKLCNTCDSVNCKYIRIDGKTNAELRQNLVTKFQTNDDIKVAVLSITAANTGITLTAAQIVVFAELFWNPGVLVQAEDRAHRIGQQDCVMVQYLVARGTADDYIWNLIQSKLDVLGMAGLTKDNFSTADSTFQKGNEQESILNYFDQLEDDECIEDSTDEPTFSTKKQKTL